MQPDERLWTICAVGDIAAPTKNALVGGPFGSNLVSRDYVDHGVPVIRGQNMGIGRWVSGDFAYVSSEKAEKLSANTARPGDLLFTQRGTLGQVAVVPQLGYESYIVSQSQMKLTVDERKADTLFLYYFFRAMNRRTTYGSTRFRPECLIPTSASYARRRCICHPWKSTRHKLLCSACREDRRELPTWRCTGRQSVPIP